MTYQHLFRLKYNSDVPTFELTRQYPKELRKISEIALLELPEDELRSLIKEENELKRLITLKAALFKKKHLKKKA